MTSSIKNFTEETNRLFDEKFSSWSGGGDYVAILNHERNQIKSFIRTREVALVDLLLKELPKSETYDVCTQCGGIGEVMSCKGISHLRRVEGYNAALREVKQKLIEIKNQL